MTLKKTLLLPAALVAGLTIASLAGCATETTTVTTPSASATSTAAADDSGSVEEILETSAKNIPFITEKITESDASGNSLSGDYTVTYKTTYTDAKSEAATLLTGGGFTAKGSDKYENDKWTVTLEGSAGKVVYKLDRK